MLTDQEAALGLAQGQLEQAQGALERHDNHRRADELERLASQLGELAGEIDGGMAALVGLFRKYNEIVLRMTACDRQAGRLVQSQHKYRGPARSGWIKCGGAEYLPVDHYSWATSFAHAANPMGIISRRCGELRGEQQERAA